MNRRPAIAVGLTLTLLTATIPVARAQELDARVNTLVPAEVDAPTTNDRVGVRRPDVLTLTSNVLGVRTSDMLARPLVPSPLSKPAMADMRLSRGAKTAIIVTAIVVGVLVIVGVVALGKPHKL